MKPGELFERINRVIQEAYKDNPNTKIYTNFKITNIAGRSREIDILIKTKTSNLDFTIAIECKDYSNAISVEKMEAFAMKCERIPTLLDIFK